MELLAESMQWCSTQKSCQNRSFNVSNGDVFRWSEVRCHACLHCCMAGCGLHVQGQRCDLSAKGFTEHNIAQAVRRLTMAAARVASEQHGC